MAICPSPRKYENIDFKEFGIKQVPIAQLTKMSEYERVTVKTKVIKVDDPEVYSRKGKTETKSHNC